MQLRITTNTADVAARFAALPALLHTALFDATGRSLDGMQQYATNFMYGNFIAPLGALESAFYQVITDMGVTGIQGQLVNPSSYSYRREYGFSGMTDSLGRYYPHDPGIAYMSNTLTANTTPVLGIFTDAVGQVIMGI